jgi:hypothetical protein
MEIETNEEETNQNHEKSGKNDKNQQGKIDTLNIHTCNIPLTILFFRFRKL